MKTRTHWLLGAVLLAVAFTIWRVGTFVPAAGPGQSASEPARAAVSGATVAGQDYVLADDERIRYIPAPDPEARRELLKESLLAQRPDSAPVDSVTVVWDGHPHIRSVEAGSPPLPRRLLHVLIDSLRVPLYRLEGIEVTREIGLPGDWVVRADADPNQYMSYLEETVQQSGYPGFRVARAARKRTAHDMHGVARTPERPIQIFRPHPGVPPAHEQTGTLLAFGRALSAAIQRPVSIHAEPQDLKLAWQDNSPAYLDLGSNINNEMVSNLLHEVSGALDVKFTHSEVELTVWQLKLNE